VRITIGTDDIYICPAAGTMLELLRFAQLLMSLNLIVWIAKFNRVFIHVFGPCETEVYEFSLTTSATKTPANGSACQ
jgi:hypothetical protein